MYRVNIIAILITIMPNNTNKMKCKKMNKSGFIIVIYSLTVNINVPLFESKGMMAEFLYRIAPNINIITDMIGNMSAVSQHFAISLIKTVL
ncbi:MAG: hypothetical protein PHT75_04605 [Bacilli bacterium]|nr:hypothetical protein [Bacilli bacterium]